MIPRRWAYTYPGEWADIRDHLASSADSEEAIDSFETAVAAKAGVPHAVAVSSGRQAMLHIFEHLGIRPGSEVIVPAYTLGDLIPLIQGLGARAVPADVDLSTFNVTADSIARRITPQTSAILVLHAFGAPADMSAILEVADSEGIPVIEDCAHSLGATLNSRQTGSFGAAGFFSFEITKPVNTWGGGMVVTRDPALALHVRERRRHGKADPEFLRKKIASVRAEQRMFETGAAFLPLSLLAFPGISNVVSALYRRVQHTAPQALRYLPWQAELGLKKLASLDERIARRTTLARTYRELLRPEIQTQALLSGATSTWYFHVAVLPVPARPVRLRLLLKGIDAGIESEIADDCAAPLGYRDCPNAADLCKRAIVLPLYDEMTIEQVARVARALNRLIP